MVGSENERTKKKKNFFFFFFTMRQVSVVFPRNVVCKARESAKAMNIAGVSACWCQKKSVVYETECRHVAVQRGKQDQNRL